jgi:hypothetical protein
MDNFIFNAITRYYSALSKLGYYKYGDVFSLLVLCFLRDFVYQDYRGVISREDYKLIERALNCLFGSSCLIPYPDYLKMGKLHIGEVTELSQRVTALEETKVLKAFDGSSEESDIIILSDDSESEE